LISCHKCYCSLNIDGLYLYSVANIFFFFLSQLPLFIGPIKHPINALISCHKRYCSLNIDGLYLYSGNVRCCQHFLFFLSQLPLYTDPIKYLINALKSCHNVCYYSLIVDIHQPINTKQFLANRLFFPFSVSLWLFHSPLVN
jgi:hypothetical protein